MNKLKPNDERAKMAKVMVWCVLFIQILMFGSHFLHYNMITDKLAGVEVSQESIELNDAREAVVALVYIVVFIISSVTFILWFRRAYYNMHQLRSSGLKYGEG